MKVSAEYTTRRCQGYDSDPHTNIVEVYIAYLRRKVDQEADRTLFRNHRGYGYSLEIE